MNLLKGIKPKFTMKKAVSNIRDFVAEGREGGWKFWRNLSFLVGLPAVGVCMANAYIAHLEHATHERLPFVPYDHMRLRGKKYPWGDGQHSFFHNPHVNALPDGYEDGH